MPIVAAKKPPIGFKITIAIFVLSCIALIFNPTKTLAVNSSTNSTTNNFLIISDIHLNNKATRPMAMKPLTYNPNNDLDHKTFIKLITAVSKDIKAGGIPKPQFILILGDIVGHEAKTDSSVKDDTSTVFSLLKKTFRNIPLFYVYGNNDSYWPNYGLFTKYSPKKTKKYSPYTMAKNNNWRDGFLSTGSRCYGSKNNIDDNNIEGYPTPCLITENNIEGYYSAYLNSNFKLIALNSVLFTVKQTDKDTEQRSQKELEWLQHQLENAQNNNETVLIALHIPVGNNIFDHQPFWRESCTKSFSKIVNTYKDNIAGIVAGHTHFDELKIIQEQQKQPDGTTKTIDTNLMLFTAGLSTSHSNLPGIKTVFYRPNTKDNDNWFLSDYIAFNFTEKHDGSITIKPLYTYLDTYCKDHMINNSNNPMLECLHNKSLSDIINNVQKYYTNGNPHFSAIILSPNDIYVKN